MINEIKKTTYKFTKRIASGEDVYDDYLKWFVSLPEAYKDFAREVYIIFSRLSFGVISLDEARTKYETAAAMPASRDKQE